MPDYLLAYIVTAAAAALTVALTLQKWRWVWQTKLAATFVPAVGILLMDNFVLAFVLCGLTLWATAHALQTVILPPGETARDFAVKLRPEGNRSLVVHIVHLVALRIAGAVLLVKKFDGKAEDEANRAQRVVARDGAREAQSRLRGALGFRRLHWVALGEIVGIWFVLQVTHLATSGSTFAVSIPVVLLTAAAILYRRTPGFASSIPRPGTKTVVVAR